jgi:hypothetical protein
MKSMSRWSKSFPLILILIALISNFSIFTIKPVSAQSNAAPTISIVYPTNGTVVGASLGMVKMVNISWQYPANNTFSWVGCSLNGPEWAHSAFPSENTTVTGKNEINYSFVSDGDFAFTLYANDTAGNWATPTNRYLPCPRRCSSTKTYNPYCFNINCNFVCPCSTCGLQKASKESSQESLTKSSQETLTNILLLQKLSVSLT